MSHMCLYINVTYYNVTFTYMCLYINVTYYNIYMCLYINVTYYNDLYVFIYKCNILQCLICVYI